MQRRFAIADIFSVTTPLTIRLPNGERRIIAELFPHPQGLLYFDLYWHRGHAEIVTHVVEGNITGEGPWKINGHIINVLGCHGSQPELADQYQQWQDYLSSSSDDYPAAPLIKAIARKLGAII